MLRILLSLRTIQCLVALLFLQIIKVLKLFSIIQPFKITLQPKEEFSLPISTVHFTLNLAKSSIIWLLKEVLVMLKKMGTL